MQYKKTIKKWDMVEQINISK